MSICLLSNEGLSSGKEFINLGQLINLAQDWKKNNNKDFNKDDAVEMLGITYNTTNLENKDNTLRYKAREQNATLEILQKLVNKSELAEVIKEDINNADFVQFKPYNFNNKDDAHGYYSSNPEYKILLESVKQKLSIDFNFEDLNNNIKNERHKAKVNLAILEQYIKMIQAHKDNTSTSNDESNTYLLYGIRTKKASLRSTPNMNNINRDSINRDSSRISELDEIFRGIPKFNEMYEENKNSTEQEEEESPSDWEDTSYVANNQTSIQLKTSKQQRGNEVQEHSLSINASQLQLKENNNKLPTTSPDLKTEQIPQSKDLNQTQELKKIEEQKDMQAVWRRAIGIRRTKVSDRTQPDTSCSKKSKRREVDKLSNNTQYQEVTEVLKKHIMKRYFQKNGTTAKDDNQQEPIVGSIYCLDGKPKFSISTESQQSHPNDELNKESRAERVTREAAVQQAGAKMNGFLPPQEDGGQELDILLLSSSTATNSRAEGKQLPPPASEELEEQEEAGSEDWPSPPTEEELKEMDRKAEPDEQYVNEKEEINIQEDADEGYENEKEAGSEDWPSPPTEEELKEMDRKAEPDEQYVNEKEEINIQEDADEGYENEKEAGSEDWPSPPTVEELKEMDRKAEPDEQYVNEKEEINIQEDADEGYENEKEAEKENRNVNVATKSEVLIENNDTATKQKISEKVSLLNKITSNQHKPIRMLISNRFSHAVAAGDEKSNIIRGAWFSSSYGISSQSAWKNIPKYQGRTAGVTIGTDAELRDSYNIIGMAYSRVESHFKYNNKLGKTALNGHIFSVYALKELPKNFSLQAIASYGHNYIKNKTKSTNNIVGKYQNNNFNIEALLRYKYRTKNGSQIIPNIGLKYDYSRNSDYKENNDIQNLTIHKKANQLFTSNLGCKIVFKKLKVLNNITFMPSIHGDIENHFHIKHPKVNAKATFKNQIINERIVLPKQPKFGYNIGGGIILSKNNIDISVEYNYYKQRKYKSHQGLVKLKVNL